MSIVQFSSVQLQNLCFTVHVFL